MSDQESADKILSASVGRNKRGIDRDIEKMSYECGLVSADELRHYDPSNDWDTQDSVFEVAIEPGDMDGIVSAMCSDDGNVRAANPRMTKRQSLMRHIGDSDGGGPVREDIPMLGVNDGPRKVCAKCKRSKGHPFFSPDARNKDGLHSWCKECRKGFTSQKRKAAK